MTFGYSSFSELKNRMISIVTDVFRGHSFNRFVFSTIIHFEAKTKDYFRKMKVKTKAALEDESVTQLYSRRKIDVESVFAPIKRNWLFKRFHL
ncbi:hypothetical protein FQ085_07580 [Planococcus sp. ANT_H30]|uniref:Transposase DDE domain-containing protein n=1 Tax=Planococcus faecalis TaxID=1598147 RepID=A0ABM6IQY8_9BACL|nr:hypothetical protein AJGP001_06930 [Planococcus faecalis]KAA0957901.1 hypothetical protein FQ085_07580 [Planococcus sp. ANT_H30]OHX54743.1 hypothetical protein BB777_06235 [Planococcus faecalis]